MESATVVLEEVLLARVDDGRSLRFGLIDHAADFGHVLLLLQVLAQCLDSDERSLRTRWYMQLVAQFVDLLL